jgi:hypothetical protein
LKIHIRILFYSGFSLDRLHWTCATAYFLRCLVIILDINFKWVGLYWSLWYSNVDCVWKSIPSPGRGEWIHGHAQVRYHFVPNACFLASFLWMVWSTVLLDNEHDICLESIGRLFNMEAAIFYFAIILFCFTIYLILHSSCPSITKMPTYKREINDSIY